MVVLIAGFAGLCGCGWHLGTPPAPALSAGPVHAAEVEPGLRAAIDVALARRLAEVGAGRGPSLVVTVERASAEPEAAIPGIDAGVVAYTAHWSLSWHVPAREGCGGVLSARRTWVQGPDEPIDTSRGRSEAVAALAGEVADRIVAAAIATPACKG